MSKLVNWGHWLVGGAFAALGLSYFYHASQFVPLLIRILRGENLSYYLPASLVLWIPLLLCAWGIWNWKGWGHVLALFLAALALCWCVRWLFYIGLHDFGGRGYIRAEFLRIILILVCILAWLLLPAVRHRYWPKESAA